MKQLIVAAICLLAAIDLRAAERHSAQGMLLGVDRTKQSITVSCDAIPGYMDAMVMAFVASEPAVLKTIQPGTPVNFIIVKRGRVLYAERLKASATSNYESEPTEAARLTLLHRTLDPTLAAKVVPVGQEVPDFALTDQLQKATHLSQFRGKVVALTFAYSRCPNPNYCFRLSNNLYRLSRRFPSRAGRDLILMTIVIDPSNDQGKGLQQYADTWKADPAVWRFLTGPIADIRQIADSFGMNFWSDEGFLIHNFHTVVIDRQGRLAANIEGNQYTFSQLGDLVETVLDKKTAETAAN